MRDGLLLGNVHQVSDKESNYSDAECGLLEKVGIHWTCFANNNVWLELIIPSRKFTL